ncbi:MAG: N-acetylglucosamine kinase [Bacilli bacterium]|nr:N-acetylglucosamine kinase [Bacilli bacterium]
MKNRQLILGVDGGNTKTDYFLFDLEGNYVDAIRCGTCSHEALRDSFAGTKRVMSEHLNKLFERNNITVDNIVGAAFGLAGADVITQKVALRKVITEIGFKKFELENDGFLGVKAASPNGFGVCSINGTGTVTVGVDDFGNFLQVGGVGYISGDESGGAFLVRRTFQAIYDELYRVGKKTSLTSKIFELYEIQDKKYFLDKIVELTDKRLINRTEIIKMLFNEANNNDSVAIEILETSGTCMGLSVAGCINNLNFKDLVHVILAGSVWSKATAMHMLNKFKEVVEENTNIDINYIILNAAPACGAVIWALEIAHGEYPKEELRQKIVSTVEEIQVGLPTT